MLKRCTWCGEEKPHDQFPYNAAMRGKLDSHCRTCYAINQKRWRKENPQQAKETRVNAHLKMKYGITFEEKMRLLEQQGGICAICGSNEPKSKYGWHVDHDHETKKVRGILCQDCNTKLDWAIQNRSSINNYLTEREIHHDLVRT
jgi:hypothetical protein